MNVLFMNLQGFERNREFLPRLFQKYEIDISIFNETQKLSDLSIYTNEVNSHANRPQGHNNINGHNSGGVYIGSNSNFVNTISK